MSWITAETTKLEKSLAAVLAAEKADDKLNQTHKKASRLLCLDLGGNPALADKFDDDDNPSFGPATAAPLLRDALGYLHAAADALAGWRDVRSSVAKSRTHYLGRATAVFLKNSKYEL